MVLPHDEEMLRRCVREELTSGDKDVSTPLFAERVRSIFYTSIDADTNIFEYYTVPYACILRFIVALDKEAVLSYTLTRDTTELRIDLNGGSSLTAYAAYAFDLPLRKDDVVNFQVAPGCKVLQLDVFKIRQAP